MSIHQTSFLLFTLFSLLSFSIAADTCRDFDNNCRDWITVNPNACDSTEYIKRSCLKSCGQCGEVDPKYDLRRLSQELTPIGFLVGKWRSEHGGKAIFPTIPKFTFGEEIEISIPGDAMQSAQALNYTAFAWSIEKRDEKNPNRAFAWSINDKDELHSEYGYISVKPNTKEVALTTVMNNGFVTVEEGPVNGNQIRFRLKDIGRISFSRDLPVHDLVREWTLLDRSTLQARLNMETLTHGMQEHTFIRYNKIEP